MTTPTTDRPIETAPDSARPASPREAVKYALGDLIAEHDRLGALIDEKFREAHELGIGVRELASAMNAYPGVTPKHYTTWGRRMAAARGERQQRKTVEPWEK